VALASSHPVYYGQTISVADFKNNPKTRRGKGLSNSKSELQLLYDFRFTANQSSPAQSLSCPSPAGFMATFYCLRFETPPTWKARSPYLYPAGTGWPGYTPRHWVFFSSPTCTGPASTRDISSVTLLVRARYMAFAVP
jgi:hypothetical protein